MAKKFTQLKEIKASHAEIVREHLRDSIQQAITQAIHDGKSEVSAVGFKIDVPLANELSDAGYTYSRAERKIKW
jgi:hypothetical protein